MKNINGRFKLSATDKKRIEAHTRAIARRAPYDGHIEAWLDSSTGDIRYCEIVGLGYMRAESSDMEYIYSATCCA